MGLKVTVSNFFRVDIGKAINDTKANCCSNLGVKTVEAFVKRALVSFFHHNAKPGKKAKKGNNLFKMNQADFNAAARIKEKLTGLVEKYPREETVAAAVGPCYF